MATINIGGRAVEVPDNLDLPENPARSLRNNVFGDAAAQAANPRTITPQITPEPIGQNPGMTGNPANNELLRAAQQRIDPVQTAARNAAGPQAPQPIGPSSTIGNDGPFSSWSRFESEVRARGNPETAGGWSPDAEAWRADQQARNNPDMLKTSTPTASPVPPTLRERVAGAARTAGGLALGAAAAYGGNKLAGAMSNVGNPGGAAPGAPTSTGSQAASQIPTDGYPKAPPAQPYNFWTDNEAGRNLGNAVQAVAPLGGLAAIAKVPGMATRAAGLADAALTGLATGVNEQRQQAAPPLAGGAATARSTAPAPIPADFRRAPFDDPRRVDRDPSRASLGASRDFTRELNALPEQLPGDLRSGVINKTVGPDGRVTYSGSNVAGGAQTVDGMGRRTSGGGTVSMMGGQPGDLTPAERLAQIERDIANHREITRLRTQIMDHDAPSPGLVEFSGETLASALRKKSDAQGSLSILDDSGISAGERATLKQNERNQNLQAETTRRGQDVLANTTRRGQDMAYAGQTRGQDIVANTTLRGQDMDLQGRLLPKQMEIQLARQMRTLRGQALAAAKGDTTAAAAILAQYGDVEGAKFMTEQSQAAQARGEKTAAAGRDRLKHLAVEVDPKTGLPTVNEAKLAAVMHNVNSMAPGYSTAPAEGQAELEPTITAGEMLRQGMNSTQNNSRWDNFWGNTKPERTKLDLRGAKAVGPVGMGWDAIGPRVSMNDVRLRLGDGSEAIVPRSVWDNQDVQELVATEGKKPYRTR